MRVSAQAFVLEPEPSRGLVRAWAAVHVVAAAAVAAVDLPVWLTLSALGTLAVHAWARRPTACSGTVVCRGDGRFDLPALGRTGLALGARSVAARGWVKLALEDGDTTLHILLIRDQLDDSSWRRLLARLATARS